MWQRLSNCASFPAANRFKQFKIYSTAFIEFVYLGWVLNHATEAAKRCWHFACKARSPSEGILHRSTLCWSWPKLTSVYDAFPFFGITVASNTNCAKRPGASWVWIWFDPWLNSIQQRCIYQTLLNWFANIWNVWSGSAWHFVQDWSLSWRLLHQFLGMQTSSIQRISKVCRKSLPYWETTVRYRKLRREGQIKVCSMELIRKMYHDVAISTCAKTFCIFLPTKCLTQVLKHVFGRHTRCLRHHLLCSSWVFKAPDIRSMACRTRASYVPQECCVFFP